MSSNLRQSLTLQQPFPHGPYQAPEPELPIESYKESLAIFRDRVIALEAENKNLRAQLQQVQQAQGQD